MKDYNGFTADQRNRSYAWLKAQWAAGLLPRPSRCCACGQDRGIIDAHAEDYSEPFGPHLLDYPLCFICHMMVHCRFKAKGAWNRYRAAIAQGYRFPAFFTRNFPAFTKLYLGDELPPHVAVITERRSFPLDDIDSGAILPQRDVLLSKG